MAKKRGRPRKVRPEEKETVVISSLDVIPESEIIPEVERGIKIIFTGTSIPTFLFKGFITRRDIAIPFYNKLQKAYRSYQRKRSENLANKVEQDTIVIDGSNKKMPI